MDFRGKKQVIINGKAKSKLFYEGQVIWSRMRSDFSVNLKNLREDEDFEGLYDERKQAIRV